MSVQLDTDLKGKGIRFKLFPQPPVLSAFREPETVWISAPAGGIQPGPADNRMYVVDAIHKAEPYELPPNMPPFRGPVNPRVEPDAHGHFDYLDSTSRAFKAAHVYGVLRRALDIWEDYFAEPIQWHFREHYQKLEIIPIIDWDNAQSGYGFIETGWGQVNGVRQPYCLNFDVIAHELGHSIIFSKVGIPNEFTVTNAYLGFHESAGDLVALLAVLHFATFGKHLLETSGGNLYALNELNRIGELSDTEQIRLASHALRMTDVVTENRELSQQEKHQLGQPLTGAFFDIFVEVFQKTLVERGLISQELDATSRRVQEMDSLNDTVQGQFTDAYRNNPEGFKAVLFAARDYLGERLAKTWRQLSPHQLSFPDVAATFMSVDRSLSGWKYQDIIRECFLWRRIGYGFRQNR